MRAWLLDEQKGIGGLRLDTVPDPTPRLGEVLLQIRFAALNPADRYLAENQYPARPVFPHILGRDGVGVVVRTGPGADAAMVGARRAILRSEAGGNRPGTFAELVSVPEQDLVEVPADWTDQEGAGATLVYLTAYQALTMWGPLPRKSTVLVTGASGGVGVAAVQLAAAMGFHVIALSRDADKRNKLLHLGAALSLDPNNPGWREQAKAAGNGRRVDLAIDNIGGKLLPQVIDTLGEHGRVSLVGRLGGPVPSFNTATLFFRRIRLGGVAVGAYANAEARAAWQEVLRLLQAAGARPVVDSVFPFEKIQDAFARLAAGPMGKVLLQVRG